MAKMYKVMFPDSKIAKEFTCGYTKMTSILNEAIAPCLKTEVIGLMTQGPYGLLNDGSSDTGIKKMNPTTVLIFDINRDSHRVEMLFYDMCTTTGEHASTAASLFESIDNAFKRDGIDWLNCFHWP